jgi:purine-cytosine permease-like protein
MCGCEVSVWMSPTPLFLEDQEGCAYWFSLYSLITVCMVLLNIVGFAFVRFVQLVVGNSQVQHYNDFHCSILSCY